MVKREGREGGRWWNRAPTSKEVAEWFREQSLHDGMKHDDFISGVVVIEGNNKLDEVDGFNEDGSPRLKEVTHRVYTPYVTVATRVDYFWKLMALHPEWLGVIEPVVTPEQDQHLPPGFFRYSVKSFAGGNEVIVNYVGCSMRVRILHRDTVKVEKRPIGTYAAPRFEDVIVGIPVVEAPPAAKAVPALSRWKTPDDHAMMKAETGAVGRALGMAGMLVTSGGVATVEDMQEVEGQSTTVPEAPNASLPPTRTADARSQDQEVNRDAIRKALGSMPEAKKKALHEWAKERGFTSLDSLAPRDEVAVLKKIQALTK